MTPDRIKPIVLVCLIIGSILFAKMIPVEITTGDAIKQVHGMTK